MSKFELIESTRQAAYQAEEMLIESISGLEEAINKAFNDEAEYNNKFVVTFNHNYDNPAINIHRNDQSITVEITKDDAIFIESENMKIKTAYVIVEAIKDWMGE